MSSCGNMSLGSCLNISKARLDGRRAVWVGSPLTMEKVTLTENFFWHSPPRFPFYESQENENIFCVADFKAFRNVRMKTASIVLCWGALLICQSKTLWRTSGWPQPTLLIQETIYHMSPESAAIDGWGASAVTVNLPAVCPSSQEPPFFWIFASFWLKYHHHTDRNERVAAMVRRMGGRLLNSHFFLRGLQALLALSVYPVSPWPPVGRMCFTGSWKEKSRRPCAALKSWLQMLTGSQSPTCGAWGHILNPS